MIYGPKAYSEHADLISEQLNPELKSYGLREHFLFWRLDGLSLARAYAVLYLQEIADLLSNSSQKHIQKAIEKQCELLGRIVSINIDEKYPTHLGSYEIYQLYCRM